MCGLFSNKTPSFVIALKVSVGKFLSFLGSILVVFSYKQNCFKWHYTKYCLLLFIYCSYTDA